MHIVHIITGLRDGGAEAVLFRLCLSRDIDARHTVISLVDKGKYGSLLRERGVDVHVIGMRRGRMNISALLRLFLLLRRSRPDATQTWMYHANLLGGLVARLAGAGRIVWGIHHSDLSDRGLDRSTRMVNNMCARISGILPSAIVSCAESATAAHIAIGYAPGKFLTVPNGYDLRDFSPDSRQSIATRRQLGLPVDVPVIGFVARWHPLKDHLSLLKAIAIVRLQQTELRCILAGPGCDHNNEDLCRLIEELGLSSCTMLLGQRGDIPAIMNLLDIHVLSSVSEAFPNVLAEAMACGTPCVVTDVGDAANIVGDTGWVVPPSDPPRLASAISCALAARKDATGWHIRQAACRERVEDNFSLARMVSRYHAAWESEE